MSSKHVAIVRGRTDGVEVGNEHSQVLSMPPSRTGVYQFGPFQLDVPERRLLRDGAQLPLRLKAFETLRVLVESAGRLVTKETLLKQVWSDAVVEENNINANVSILRKALGEDANGQSYIETVPRFGVGLLFSGSRRCPYSREGILPSIPAGSRSTSRRIASHSISVIRLEN